LQKAGDGMWFNVLLALFITMMVGYLIETIKVKRIAHDIRAINFEIYGILAALMNDVKEIDLFFIHHLRDSLKVQLTEVYGIDEFQLYKLTQNKLRLVYRKGKAVQRIDLFLEDNRWSFKDVEFEYTENPFEEVRLQ
jgi:signal transduction histidine kinase